MGSGLHEVGFESLSIMDDGKLNAALVTHLQRASKDCQDRPTEPKVRTVTVNFTFEPVVEQDGDCTEAWMQVKITSKIPDHKSKAYSVGLRRNNSFVFSEHSLGNVNQGTMDYGDDDQ